MPTDDLTYDKLLAVMRQFPPPPPSLFDSLFKPQTLMGMRVFEAPPPSPKIQLRDIKLSDGTPLFSPEFRAETNGWLIEQFGFRDDPFKDKAFMLNGGIVMSKTHMAMAFNVA